MAFCGKCGAKMEEGVKFCPICGESTAPAKTTAAPEAVPAADTAQTIADKTEALGDKLSELNNTADTTDAFDQTDILNNKTMAVLAYFGPLVLIPIFAAKNSPYARYHSNQGLVLLLAMVAWNIVYGIVSSLLYAISWRLGFISTILSLVSVVFAVLAIIGIINAAKGRAKELPLIGKIKILK